jgi:hypothetical protein
MGGLDNDCKIINTRRDLANLRREPKLNWFLYLAILSPSKPQSIMSIQAETWDSGSQPPRSVAEAFAYCERLARTHYENFPVGSLLIPRDRRRHVYSVYAFARIADDFADEVYETGELTEARRLDALDDWGRKLEDCYRGRADHPVFIALAETVRELRLPVQLFRDLLSAFKQDVVKRRALGEPGRPLDPALVRLPRGAPARPFGLHLHGAAAGQFLAGCGSRHTERSSLLAAK